SSVDYTSQASFAIDWGDGNTETITGPASHTTVNHIYTEAGIYDVRVIATDKDGGISAPTHLNFWVYKAQVQGGDLYVGGSTGNDTITITKLANGQVNLVVNGEDLGSYFLGYTGADGGGVILYAHAGN